MSEVGGNAPDWIALRSIIPLESSRSPLTVRGICDISADTAKRNYPHLIKKVSEKREGMTLGDALDIAAGTAEKKPAGPPT
jgi:hypothetical protein